jgi:hypothetical protein
MFNKQMAPQTQATTAPREKLYTVPADINVALLHTIIAVTALRDVLTKETEALKMTKSALFLELQDEMVEVARRYETLVNALMDRPGELKNADAKLKSQLQRLQADFNIVTNENLQWIERMRAATEKLGERIMKSARTSAERQTQFAYGASGKMQRGASKVSIGTDERV